MLCTRPLEKNLQGSQFLFLLSIQMHCPQCCRGMSNKTAQYAHPPMDNCHSGLFKPLRRSQLETLEILLLVSKTASSLECWSDWSENYIFWYSWHIFALVSAETVLLVFQCTSGSPRVPKAKRAQYDSLRQRLAYGHSQQSEASTSKAWNVIHTDLMCPMSPWVCSKRRQWWKFKRTLFVITCWPHATTKAPFLRERWHSPSLDAFLGWGKDRQGLQIWQTPSSKCTWTDWLFSWVVSPCAG